MAIGTFHGFSSSGEHVGSSLTRLFTRDNTPPCIDDLNLIVCGFDLAHRASLLLFIEHETGAVWVMKDRRRGGVGFPVCLLAPHSPDLNIRDCRFPPEGDGDVTIYPRLPQIYTYTAKPIYEEIEYPSVAKPGEDYENLGWKWGTQLEGCERLGDVIGESGDEYFGGGWECHVDPKTGIAYTWSWDEDVK